ncbi:MAG: ABC transporter permease [Firmicutes bacterium]|nr:ABC transporter permease [Bacillota bacterium]
MYLLKRLEVISLINLIKNEIYKILHKKSLYIVLLITTLFVLLTQLIYNSDLTVSVYIEDNYESEEYFVKVMENEGETDSEEYLDSKIYVETYKYADSFGKDSWQKYIINNHEIYNGKVYSIIERIVKYELGKNKNKIEYEEALKEKEELTKELKNLDWKTFLKNDIERIKINIKNSESAEKYYLEAELEVLYLREKYNIEYKYDEFNEYLDNYKSNRATLISYEIVDEDNLKPEQKNIIKEAKKEVELAKYKIENHIEKIEYGSNHYILSNFYTEYFTMIIIIIILISGSIVSEEFSKGTIKLLLVKPYTRTKILISKYITVLLTILFAVVFTLIMQLIIGGIFFGYDTLSIPHITYNLTTNTIEAIHIFKYLLLLTITTLPKLIIIGTISFMISTIFTSTSLANTLTLIFVFGSDVLNVIAEGFEIEWLKFSPTLNWDFSVYLFGGTSPYKGVTLPFSIINCLVYFILMIVVTIIIFKRKNIKNI